MEMIFVMGALAVMGGVGMVFSFFFIIALAAFVYSWTNALPWLRKVSAWAARPVNFVGLVLLMAVLLFALVVLIFLLLNASDLTLLLFAALILLVLGFMAFINFPIALAVVNYILGIGRWAYCGYRSFVDNLYTSSRLAVLRAKIKVDTIKEPGIKSKFEGFKDELSQDIQKAKRKISKRGDKDDLEG